jgi:predicted phage-related endonuclease
MAAILGLDPFKSAKDIWLQKKHRLVDEPPKAVLKAGTMFEAGVLDWAEEQLGHLTRNVPAVLPDTPLMANIDAIVDGEAREPVEAKTAGLFGPLRNEWWGEEGSDQVPDRVIVQAHVHMLCRWNPGGDYSEKRESARLCHVPAFIGGRGFAMFRVPFNHRLGETIVTRACEFWQQNVLADLPPTESHASLELVRKIIRVPQKVVGLDPQLVANWLAAKEAAAGTEKAAKSAQADLIAAMSDGEAGLCGELGAVTYYQSSRKSYTVKESTYRTLRHCPNGIRLPDQKDKEGEPTT